MTTHEMAQKTGTPSVLLTEATVHSVVRVSPAFVRVELASPAFVDLGEGGFDTRFKVVLPGATGELPPIPEVAEEWYETWMSAPDGVRPPMRTYTIRDIVRDGDTVRLVVDFAVHEDPGHSQGPACRWALAARPGQAIQVIVPHRLTEYDGTEFDPTGRQHLMLIGDETAVPAVARILEDLGPGYTGEVYLEVPTGDDILDLAVPNGFAVRWFPRNEDARGRRLVQEVRCHLGLPPSTEFDALPELPSDLDIDVWETPRYSSAGEDIGAQLHTRLLGHDLDDTYAWIAGESWMVRAMRRSLVTELGVDRAQVAFMGYWRVGVSMRS
jgi:NADPH-dependent ferric siderophore reductase